MIIGAGTVATPVFDWHALAPIVALSAGMVVSLLAGLLPGRGGRTIAVWSGVAAAASAATFAVGLWDEPATAKVIAGSLVIDRAALVAIVICCAAAIAGIAIAARGRGTEDAGHGETTSLIIASTLGMVILASANDLVTVFLGLELLSVPLYILCASHVDRTASLESGLKYLILGSVGSATALMGIALIYGGTGEMQLDKIAAVAGEGELRGLVLPGIALLVAGFGFKLSLAPLHQWTPDVYDGAPTAVTAFMSVATKAAALVVTARILITCFGSPDADLYPVWHWMLMILAAASIIIGNVGALGQPSMKRLMGYSSVAQAGYLVAALSVGALGAMLAYLGAYAVSTLAVFAVVAAREVERPDLGDDVAALDGIGKERPLLAWLGTIGLFGLAGLPLTAGFFGKVVVSGSLIAADETWLAVLLIVGSIISLAYYAPPVLRMWRSAPAPAPDPLGAPDGAGTPVPAPALVAVGGAPEATPPQVTGGPYGFKRSRLAGSRSAEAGVLRAPWELGAVALIAAVLVIAGGVYPQPMLELAEEAAQSLLSTIR